jgi:hypothetical protein
VLGFGAGFGCAACLFAGAATMAFGYVGYVRSNGMIEPVSVADSETVTDSDPATVTESAPATDPAPATAQVTEVAPVTDAAPVTVAEPAPVKVSAPRRRAVAVVNPRTRVIHSRGGDKPVDVDKNIAITSADGHTVVGTLVAVENGYVDVKTSAAQVRIAEKDVLDAATY